MQRERRSPTPAAARKREAIRRLKNALAEQRFVLHYQPIVRADDSRVVGVEALLRWRRPDEEKDDITELLASVERSPVIFKLENWTLDQAFRAAREWQEAGLTGVRVGVNLSAREFPRADIVHRLRGKLARAGLGAAGVALEITETSSMSDFTTAADRLERLSAMGIELWLDDFGTGHSSLEWLSRLPACGVKIAGTFVDRLLTEKRCQAIVARVVELAHDLEMRVIAESVESGEQRETLTRLGADLLQGFLFHPPMPAEQLPEALLRAGTPASATSIR
jgi:EAL domain-containing protein (putative c-di-GMP-specific phosphodiesterase class I)